METNERLASVEAKLEIFLGLLKEIRNDLKNLPPRAEVDKLTSRVEELEKNYIKLAVKIGGLSMFVSLVISIVAAYIKG